MFLSAVLLCQQLIICHTANSVSSSWKVLRVLQVQVLLDYLRWDFMGRAQTDTQTLSVQTEPNLATNHWKRWRSC